MNFMKLGLVVCEFNADITAMMEERAKAHAEFLGAEIVRTIKVPGAFDAPIAVQHLLEKEVDAVVALGAVLEGDTQHDEIVSQHAARKLMDLSLQYKKPVALAISGPGMTRLQAQERIDEYAKRGVESAVKLLKRLKE
ncbi:6,7-dimethyl-8-ribityllumazine synthase [Candidatus Micrarchaeota archaeon]|nr:6,7-dimethyl-8-ribityllumazine synthase [Candidatus Micrarchaeota archaeon]